MNKMNNNSNKDIQKSNKKSDEYRSLNAAKEKLPFLKNLTDIHSQIKKAQILFLSTMSATGLV